MALIKLMGYSGGQTVTLLAYVGTSESVGKLLPLGLKQVPTATSGTIYQGDSDIVITDVISHKIGAKGSIQVLAANQPTAKIIDLSAHDANNPGRPALNIPIYKGQMYSLQVIEAIS